MPTKNLDKYSRVKPSIAFYSKKNNRQMFCESRVEVGALYELEFDPNIRRYQTQPDSFSYTRNGARRRYTPDLLCEDQKGNFWFEEIKSWRGANEAGFQEKHHFLTQLFADVIGHPLKLRVSNSTYHCPWRRNLLFLYRYLGYAFSNAIYSVLKSIETPQPIRNILAAQRSEKLHADSVYAGLAQGLLTFDKFRKVDLQTVVWGTKHD